MSHLTLSAAGGASAEQAWERYAQVAYWSRWSPQIRSVTCSAPRIRAGATGRVHAVLGLQVPFAVDSVDEPARTWVWTVRKGPLTLHLIHRVTPQEQGCRTTLEMAGPLPVLLAYAPLARLALGRLVRPRL